MVIYFMNWCYTCKFSFIRQFTKSYRDVSYCSKWRLRTNVSKSAVMVFSKDAVNGCWKWGEYSLPIVSSYSYVGIDFSRNGACMGYAYI